MAGPNVIQQIDSEGNVYRASPKKVVVDVTLSLDTAIYAALEVLADTQVITNAFRAADIGGTLESVTVIDLDHLAAAADAMDLWFLDEDVSIGAENSAPNISDANAIKVHAKVSLVTADFIDFTGSRIACIGGLNRVLKPIAGTRNLAMAATCGAGAAPTHTAAGVVVRLGILQD